jgi:hypothetical protein
VERVQRLINKLEKTKGLFTLAIFAGISIAIFFF